MISFGSVCTPPTQEEVSEMSTEFTRMAERFPGLEYLTPWARVMQISETSAGEVGILSESGPRTDETME